MRKMLILLLSGVLLSGISVVFAQDAERGSISYFEIKKLLYIDENYEEALSKVNQEIEYSPNVAELYSLRGRIYNEMDNKDAALVDFDKAIELSPKDDELYYWRAFLKYEMRDVENAYVDASRCIQINPNNSSCYTVRAVVRSDLGDKAGFNADMNRASAALQNEFKPQNSLNR